MTTFIYLVASKVHIPSYRDDVSVNDILLLLVHYHNLINYTHTKLTTIILLTINVGELAHVD